MEDGLVKVISPIEDTPAYKAGIKPGDLIVKLDDTQVKGLSLNDAVKRMRGRAGTQITLTIVRKGEPQPIVVTLTRAEIKVQSVKSKMIEPGFAWVRISQFQETTADSLVRHLETLFKQGQMKGLVLDLRNDPGGLLYGAVAISAAFLPAKALVVSTDGRTEDARKKFYAVNEDYLRGLKDDVLKTLPAAAKTVPMVVLVNGGSASASEIVAGALQDHKRATVIGTQTFGKGSVQTIMPLGNNTAIKLTTSRYYTPSGRSIQAKGITPDLIVEELGATLARLRESDLTRHLQNGQERDAEKQPRAKPAAPVSGEQQRPVELGSKDDFQLQQAIAFLKGEPVKGLQPSVAATKPPAKAN
jgi:carboxyl-terminal processing protease